MEQHSPERDEIEELLSRVRAGDREAVDRLLACHRPYLRRLIELRLDPKVRSRVDASDIVQEAQLEAVRRLDAYLKKSPMPFRLWLRQIAFDHVLKARRFHVETDRRALRREVRLPERSSLVLARQLFHAGSTPSRQLTKVELAERVREAITKLPESDREILLLRHYEGLSNQEVGCMLAIDPATASKRHGRAMLRLHKILFAGGMTESQL